MSDPGVRLEPVAYRGWAPCFHGGRDTKTDQEWTADREAWMKSILPETWWADPSTTKIILGGAEGKPDLTEKLLWELALSKTVTLGADQWVGVGVEGGEFCDVWNDDTTEEECPHDTPCRRVTTYIQGDDFIVALVESYRWWKERETQAPS
jgi:hypothetical protein